MTTGTSTAAIPDVEHATGFAAVAVRFPADPLAHRATSIYHKADGTTGGMPIRLAAAQPGWTEVRPGCRPDSDPTERYYPLSIPSVLARGGLPCGQPECYGGAA